MEHLTPEEALAYQKKLIDKALAIVEAKRQDYSGKEDPFRNFRSSEAISGVETWRGILVRIGDKLSRIRSIMETGERLVNDETLEDTLCDVINYVCILGGLLQEKLKDGDSNESS